MNMDIDEGLEQGSACESGRVLAWGANSYGQLGLGDQVDRLEGVCSEDYPDSIKYITGGGGHTLVVTESGQLYVCGANSKGELSLNHTNNILVPTLVTALQTQHITKVAAGWEFTLAVTDTGRVYSCGSNIFGQLGRQTPLKYSSVPELVPSFGEDNKVIDVAAGLRHALVLTETGSVYSWGQGKKGQLGVTGSDGTVPKIAYQPVKVNLPEKMHQIFCGAHHSGAVSTTGSVYMWGCNKYGQLGQDTTESPSCHLPIVIPSSLFNSPVTHVRSGWTHCLLLTVKEEVYSWGRGDYGQLGRPVPSCTNCDSIPTLIPGINNIKKIATGSEHNLALTGQGRVLSWGWNEHGICGNGTEHNVLTPQLVPNLTSATISHIGCGAGHSLAVIK